MNDQYYYATDGKRSGPISFSQLRQLAVKGELKRHQKVWSKGMKDWQSAASVEKLFDDLPPDLDPERAGSLPLLPEEESISIPVTRSISTQPSKAEAELSL